MDKRYKQFNEVTFEAYVKSAVDKSVLKARLKKSARGELEQTFSMLSETALNTLTAKGTATERVEMELECQLFDVRGIQVPVYDYKLGYALSYLMPQDREIILLYFFRGLNDRSISNVIGISRAAVQRHRKNALNKLQVLLEGTL